MRFILLSLLAAFLPLCAETTPTPEKKEAEKTRKERREERRRKKEAEKEKENDWYKFADFGPAHIQTWADTFEGEYRSDAAVKGVILRPNPDDKNLVVLFDAETLQMLTATTKGVSLDNTPFKGAHGSQNKVNNAEDALFNSANGPEWANSEGQFEDSREHAGHGNFDYMHFAGYYRHGHQVILDLKVHDQTVLTSIEVDPESKMGLKQVFDYQGQASDKLKRQNAAGLESVEKDLSELIQGGPAIYPETFEVQAELGTGKGPYLIDQIPLPPVLEASPYLNKIRLTDFDFFADGNRAALCTWDGDVWLLSGLKDFKTLTWKRFASGLFEPLGLKVVDEVIHVSARDGVWQIIDLNDDQEADHYKVFNYDLLITDNFHEFSFGLETDNEGNFYFAKAAPVRAGGRNFDKILPHNGTVLKLSKDGKDLEVIATGLRAPGGIGVGPNGEITTGENEGTWQPCCKINYFTQEQQPVFLGTEQVRHQVKTDFHEPLCYLPMNVDNSGGGQIWVPEEARIGIAKGELLHLSYGQSTVYHVLSQSVEDGQIQGGVVKLPIKLSSSAQRADFHPDGSMYLCGMRGWQTNAASEAGIQRVRYQEGTPLGLPNFLSVKGDQLTLRFDCPLDEELAIDPESYSIKRWKYIRGPQYGSGHYSIDNPDAEAEAVALKKESKSHMKSDKVEVSSAKLNEDGKTVVLTIPSLKPAQQMKIDYDLESTDGDVLIGTVTSTIHQN